VGGNWGNAGAVRHIWRAPGARPAIPQVIMYERVVTPGDAAIAFGPERRLARFVGTDEIVAWVVRGAPVPRTPAPRATTKRRAPAG
jgi:hypothetical protein